MKTEISRDSHQLEKRYSGVYQQQGRMLTDADWNELVEILKERLNNALKDIVGSKAGGIGGTPRHRALKIVEDGAGTFEIQPGHIYVDGVSAQLPGDTNFAYKDQQDFPKPPTPSGNYVLYVDVWERTVTPLMDDRLRDKGLHGADTCTRKQTMAQLKWCTYDPSKPSNPDNDPETSPKNPAKGNSSLSLTLLQKSIEPDPCDPCISQLDVASKVGNYLFRVEVHDVQGHANDPTAITLKWSRENGAEQFEALAEKEAMPAGFISDNWIYEFFDETSEKHLGVHLANTTWAPTRGELVKFEESTPYDVPEIPESNKKYTFVRRWDGYCTLDIIAKELIGWDRKVELSTKKAVDSSGYVNIDDSLQIVLDSIELDLELRGKTFVAGDYWLADVREAEHDPLDPEKTSNLLISESPHGIEHHYLTLGKMINGSLEEDPESDRKYAFPSLTEMTRMFHVAGDGQEAMPGHELPQPIEVGVANGEWPVNSASVKFTIETGDGAISLIQGKFGIARSFVIDSNPDNGVYKCYWKLGDGIADHSKEQRLKAELLGPDGSTPLNHPPLYFNANLSTADQVAYDPACESSEANTVHNLLVADAPAPPETEPYPLTLEAYKYYTVKEVLDALLCKLKAKHIPYDPTNIDRWNDINFEEDPTATPPGTVQKAIDALLDNLHSEDIKYPLPVCSSDTDTLLSNIRDDIANIETVETSGIDYARIRDLWDALLCHLDAAKIPYDSGIEATRWADIIENRPLQAAWVKRFGSIGADYLRGLAVDNQGNIVFAGTFSDTITFGGTSLTSYGDSDIYLVKLNADGEHIWSISLGSPANDTGQAAVIDNNGNVILVAGFSETIEMAGDCGTFVSQGSNDILVAKFSASDGSCEWAQSFGGSATDFGYTAAIAPDGNVILSGFFTGQVDFGEISLESEGEADIFLAKLDSSNNGTPIWAYNYGGDGYDMGHNVAVQANGDIILTGFFQQTVAFSELVPALVSEGKSDIFVAGFDSEGVCLWARRFGGTRSDYGRGLALDVHGNIYLTGYFQQEINFGSDADILTGTGGYDIYIAKLTSDGDHLWSRAFPGTGAEYGHAITVTSDGNIVLAGFFSDRVNFGGLDLISQGETDGFLAFFSPEATHLHSEAIGAAGADQATRLATGPGNSLVLTGTFSGNTEIAGVPLTSGGHSDVFVASFVAPSAGPTTIQSAIDVFISGLESSDIGYQIPPCSSVSDSVRHRLPSIKNLPDRADSTILELLNALLCELDASTIPYDRNTDSGSLIDGFVNTTGDTVTGSLRIQDNLIVDDNIGVGTSENPTAKLAVNGGVHVGGESDPGDDNLLVDGDCMISGNLTVNGTTTTVNTEEMTIEDPVITLNRYVSPDPNTRNSGIEVYRGSDEKAHLTWNEALDRWEYGTEGNMLPIAGGQQALVTGAVSFNYMPVGEQMRSNWINPGLGSGKLCVVLGNWISSGIFFNGDENAGFRDVIYRAEVDANNGRLRIYAKRISGSGRITRKVQWWAMLPGSEENDQAVSIGITISPPSASIQIGASIVFEATVSGATNTGVLWQVQEGSVGGSVTTTGLYTAPDAAGVYHVVVTASADSTIKDTATVTVSKPKENDKDINEKNKDKDLVDKLKDGDKISEKVAEMVSIRQDSLSQSTMVDTNTGGLKSDIQPTGRAFIRQEERPVLSSSRGERRE